MLHRTAFVTAQGQLYRSLDGGLSWTAVGLPPEATGLSDLVVNRQGIVQVATDLGVWRYTTQAQDIVVNGSFEAYSGWELPSTPWPAGYSDRLDTLFWTLSNAQTWTSYTFDLDLDSYRGRPIKLHFGVYNDLAGGRTGMYVDNVSLVVQRPAPEMANRAYLPLVLRTGEP